MRIVDANAVKEALRNRISENIDECINNVPTVDVLDKIRAEIVNMQIVYDKSANYKDERTDEEKANDLGKMYKVLVLSIIDKYKSESEGKE